MALTYLRCLPLALLLAFASSAAAQLAPSIGYMYPPGGQAGRTIEVTLGGYDWTPDMQVFVHDPRIRLEIVGPPGPVIVPEPPYWFGKKARRAPFPLPREFPARLTTPADMPPGVVLWQVANANGASAVGRLVVGDVAEVVEIDGRTAPQALETLPVTVSGQVKKIAEVDRYQFTAPHTGPITCAATARALGSELNAVLEVRDDEGRLLADAADTAGSDTAVTFAAVAGRRYTVSLYDLDFRGDGSFVYRLALTPGPRVVAAIPASGRRGETRPVELIGYGVATGAIQLESVTREISFPAAADADTFLYRLETPFGAAPWFSLGVSDLPETVEPAPEAVRDLSLPAAVTGVIEEPYGEDRYRITGAKGNVWAIQSVGRRTDSPLDVAVTVLDAEGKELARSDDVPGSTDAGLEFTLPADGVYQVCVADASPGSGERASVYRLTVEPAQPGFALSAPEMLAVPLGGAGSLAIKATRRGGFKDPITVTLAGLPAGVTAPPELTIPAGQSALNIALTAAADAAAGASLVVVAGEGKSGETALRHQTGPVLVAATLPPPFAIDAEGKDDVTKWPRGSTFPGPVLIERNEGFNSEIVLEMTSRQGRHRQGIAGPELVVPPGVGRILYPVFLPEWLETTRTSRMVVNGVAKVADPQGNIRYSLVRQKTRMGFLPTGALLKIGADVSEIPLEGRQRFSVPLTLSRSPKLSEPLRLELRPTNGFTAEPVTLTAGQTTLAFPITVAAATAGEHELTIRATILEGGQYPVISETTVLVLVGEQVATK